MTPETLKIACEAAGFDITNTHHWLVEGWEIVDTPIETPDSAPGHRSWYSYSIHDPALLPFMAEQLIARIYNMNDRYLERYDQAIECSDYMPSYAPAEHRILAALVALGLISMERAEKEIEGHPQ